MIDENSISEIVKLYEKHGWKLRRILLSSILSKSLEGKGNLFCDALVVESSLDALWFSRVSNPGSEAWELRHLSTVPFALVDVIADEDESTINVRLEQIENKMKETILSRGN